MVPDVGAGSSTVALSLSISTIESSAATASPSCFFHVPTITSVIDSPTSGTFSSMGMVVRRRPAASWGICQLMNAAESSSFCSMS